MAKKVSAEKFLSLQFKEVCLHAQAFGDKFEKEGFEKFNKGICIMVYFYVYLYLLLYFLKKDYTDEFLDYLKEGITGGYLKDIPFPTKVNIEKYWSQINKDLDLAFENGFPEPKLIAKLLQVAAFDTEYDAFLFISIVESLSNDIKDIVESIKKYTVSESNTICLLDFINLHLKELKLAGVVFAITLAISFMTFFLIYL